ACGDALDLGSGSGEFADPGGSCCRSDAPRGNAHNRKRLPGDVAFERSKSSAALANPILIAKDQKMTDRPAESGKGALFKNDRKQGATQPGYRGDATINGQKFWVSAWIKEGQRGKYMSLAFRAVEEDRRQKSDPQAPLGDARGQGSAVADEI